MWRWNDINFTVSYVELCMRRITVYTLNVPIIMLKWYRLYSTLTFNSSYLEMIILIPDKHFWYRQIYSLGSRFSIYQTDRNTALLHKSEKFTERWESIYSWFSTVLAANGSLSKIQTTSKMWSKYLPYYWLKI